MNTHGYSFIELVISLAIAATLLSLSTLQWQETFTKNQAATAATRLEAAISRLAVSAMRTGCAIDVIFEQGERSFYAQTACDTTAVPWHQRLQVAYHTVVTQVRFAKIDAQTNTLRLHPNGNATPGTITLASSNQRCALRQALRGRRTIICDDIP